MPSLKYLRPRYCPLRSGPHPIWSTCKSPSQVRLATIQAKMLEGTYRSCHHVRHWQKTTGVCQLPGCRHLPGDVLHLFSSCPFLKLIVDSAIYKALDVLSHYTVMHNLISNRMSSPPIQFLTFLLDPSTDHESIDIVHHHGSDVLSHLFLTSRSIIWHVHKARMKAVGLS